MEPIIAVLAGISIGFVLGVVAVSLWPTKIKAAEAVVTGDAEKLAKAVEAGVTSGLASVHQKLDIALSYIKPK